MALPSTQSVLRNLWLGAGLPATYLESANINLINSSQHVLPSSFRIGCAAQASIAATALAASLYQTLTEGKGTVQVSVDARQAALEFASEKYSRLQRSNQLKNESVHVSHPEFKKMLDLPLDTPADWDPLAGYYKCSQGRYVRLHTNWEHHKLGLLKILGLSESANREEVESALLSWDAKQFESEAIEAGMCATMCRTPKEWNDTEMARSIKISLNENHGCPVKVTRVKGRGGSLGRREVTRNKALRVIDLSRVIAAPVATRTLAKHGADVLLLSSPRLPNLPMLEIDTTRGKRSAEVDLETEEGRQTMAGLAQTADVLLQAYRPGSLAKRGYGFDDLQKLRPGLIYAELSAYGFTGPWKHVRGFDSLVQSASGINLSEAESLEDFQQKKGQSRNSKPLSPGVLPCQALDHASGYLLAFGVLAARCRRQLDGEDNQDGWHVQVSLSGVAAWLESLGRVHGKEAWEVPKPIESEGKEVMDLLEPYHVRSAKEAITLYAMRHSALDLPFHQANTVPARLGVDFPEWL